MKDSERSEAMNVEEEVDRLKEEIKRLGKLQDDGSYKVITMFSIYKRDFISSLFFLFGSLFIFQVNSFFPVLIFLRM